MIEGIEGIEGIAGTRFSVDVVDSLTGRSDYNYCQIAKAMAFPVPASER